MTRRQQIALVPAAAQRMAERRKHSAPLLVLGLGTSNELAPLCPKDLDLGAVFFRRVRLLDPPSMWTLGVDGARWDGKEMENCFRIALLSTSIWSSCRHHQSLSSPGVAGVCACTETLPALPAESQDSCADGGRWRQHCRRCRIECLLSFRRRDRNAVRAWE